MFVLFTANGIRSNLFQHHNSTLSIILLFAYRPAFTTGRTSTFPIQHFVVTVMPVSLHIFFSLFFPLYLLSDITVECFEKARRSKPLFPLKALQNFEILFSDSPRVGMANPPRNIPTFISTRDNTQRQQPTLQFRDPPPRGTINGQQKGPDNESKVTSGKSEESVSAIKESSPSKKTKPTANEEKENKADDGKSKKVTSGKPVENHASDNNDSTKLSSEKVDGERMSSRGDLAKVSPVRAIENHMSGSIDSKRIFPAKFPDNSVSSERRSKQVSVVAKSAENHVSPDSNSRKASTGRCDDNHATDDSDLKNLSPAASAEIRLVGIGESKKLSPAKSAVKHAPDNDDSKSASASAQSAKHNLNDDIDSKKTSPAKSDEHRASDASDSKKVSTAESSSNKLSLSTSLEPNSHTLSAETTRKPLSGRRTSNKLPNLPTPAPPLVSGIDRLQKSPYAEPVLLKMTHSSPGEHKKGKGGRQSRGS